MIGPKVPIWRSEKYRRYVASFRCFGCGVEGYSQCAHANYGKGRGIKVGDDLTFPLCAPRFGLPGCHMEHDLCLGMDRNMRREAEARYVEQMQTIAAEDGWKLPGFKVAA